MPSWSKQLFHTSSGYLLTDISTHIYLHICHSSYRTHGKNLHIIIQISKGTLTSLFSNFKYLFVYIWYLSSPLEDKFYYGSDLACLVLILLLASGYVPGINRFSKYWLNLSVNVGSNDRTLLSYCLLYPWVHQISNKTFLKHKLPSSHYVYVKFMWR